MTCTGDRTASLVSLWVVIVNKVTDTSLPTYWNNWRIARGLFRIPGHFYVDVTIYYGTIDGAISGRLQ